LRQYLKGWREIYCLKIRTELLNKIDALDIKAKTVLLLPHEVELRNQLKWKLTKFLREEEIYWFQRSKAIKLLEGDCHTRFPERNPMHLICVPGSSSTHMIDKMSVIS
jgi:hypothetical protein